MALTDAGGADVVIEEIGPRFIVTLAGTVNRGDIVGYSSGWKRAIATTGGVIQGRYVALESGSSGESIQVSRVAVLVGDRFAGGTPNAPLYVAEGSGNDGEYTETAPSTTGDANTPIGVILAANRLHVFAQVRLDSVA